VENLNRVRLRNSAIFPARVTRRIGIALAIALAALCLGCRSDGGHAGGQRNILLNGDLTDGTGNSPADWESAAWQAKSAVFRWNHPAGVPGELQISSDQPNDAHWSQTVHLSPGWYHFSASMRAEGVTHGGGGAILYEFVNGVGSEALYGTTNWQTVGFYLKAGSSGADAKLACRLGGFASLNTGKAFCRDLRVVEVATPPTDAAAFTFDLDLMHAQAAPAQPPVAATSLTEAHDISSDAGASQASFGEKVLEYSLDIVDWTTAFLVLLAAMLMIVLSKARAFAKERSQAGSWWQDGDQGIAIGWPRWLWKQDANAQAETSAARRETAAESLAVVTAGFFMFALVLACVRIAPIAWFKSGPGYLAFFAAAIAVAGLAVRSINQESTSLRCPMLALSPGGWSTLAVFCVFLAFYAVTGFAETGYNEQVRQALAFLHGHTYIDAPENSYIEYYQVGIHKYALQPPLPAVFLMPLAAIWGIDAPQTAFSMILGAFDVALAWRLLGKFRLNLNARVWLTLFFGAGTVFWYQAIQGRTWDIPFVVAVLFTLAALIETFGNARPLWLGIFGGLAALSRYELVLIGPVYAALAYTRGRRIGELLWMAPGFAMAGVAFAGFNEIRYGSFFDTGILAFGPNVPRLGLQYLPGNLYTIFFIAPQMNTTFPYLHPIGMGQALTFTSPAFVLALRADCRQAPTLMIWLATILASGAALLWYANGYSQFGTRLYLQAFPFLLVLMALGTRRRADQLTRILIGTSIALVTFGMWHIHMWGLD
jgi:hypothetical protein